MGRHRKTSESNLRRNSIIAISGLVPAGLASTAGAFTAHDIAPERNALIDTSSLVPVGSGPSEIAGHASAHAKAIARGPAPVATMTRPEPQLPTSLASSPLGLPPIAKAAYKNAERTLADEMPGCGMSWDLLAGIGRVESRHANNGAVDASGTTVTPIYGPALDGTLAGNEVIGDGAGGYQRAMGPMQFMPGTWKRYAAPGANPQNLFDAAHTAGKYLCAGGLDMRSDAQRTKAILRYNHSMAYVANVMAWSLGYATGVTPQSSSLPRI